MFISSGYAISQLMDKGMSSGVETVRWKESSISCGYVISSMEVINYILNGKPKPDPVRRLMRDKSQFAAVGYSAMYFCAAIYVVPALLMYMAYEGNLDPKLQDLYYRTFIAKSFIKFLNDLMNINFLYGMTSFTIYNMEMLEKIKMFKPLIRDQEMNLRSFNVLMFRVVFVVGVLLISTFITDLRLVYAFNGVLLNSFIGLIIPGLMGVMRTEQNRSKDSFAAKCSDWLCLIAGALSLLLFFFDLAIGKD